MVVVVVVVLMFLTITYIVYLLTFTFKIKINQMWVSLPSMDPMGYIKGMILFAGTWKCFRCIPSISKPEDLSQSASSNHIIWAAL